MPLPFTLRSVITDLTAAGSDYPEFHRRAAPFSASVQLDAGLRAIASQ